METGAFMAADQDSPTRVLHVIGAMDRGGAEALIMNIFRSIDRSRLQFDFLVHEDRECAYDAEIRELGGSIYRVPRFVGANYFDYRSRCRRFFAEHGDYSVVHGHIGSCAAIYLSEARRAGLYAVAHSHNTNNRDLVRIPFAAMSYHTRFVADAFFACSLAAGIDRFGRKIVSGPRFHVVNNGIILERYRFSESCRRIVRSELGIADDVPLLCHVGRFVSQKNHRFLLETFSWVAERRPDARLVLVGGGPLEQEMKRLSKELGIASRVFFLGVREDVASILMASDLFIFRRSGRGSASPRLRLRQPGFPVCFPRHFRPCQRSVTVRRFCLSRTVLKGGLQLQLIISKQTVKTAPPKSSL